MFQHREMHLRNLQGFGAGAAQSRGIWLKPEPSLCSLLPGAGAGSGLKIPGAVLKQAGSETLYVKMCKMCKMWRYRLILRAKE